MHGAIPETAGHAAGVILGLSPLLVSLAIFVLTYAIIVTEKINRSIVALLGAGLMILSGALTQAGAVSGKADPRHDQQRLRRQGLVGHLSGIGLGDGEAARP